LIACDEQGVAVGLRFRHDVGTNVGAAAAAVIHHHRLPNSLLETLRNEAGQGISHATGCVRDYEMDRLVGIGRGCARRQGE
jgi:hypothetical protein